MRVGIVLAEYFVDELVVRFAFEIGLIDMTAAKVDEAALFIDEPALGSLNVA